METTDAVQPRLPSAVAGERAQHVALAYLAAATATWQGRSAAAFTAWLASYWTPRLPERPRRDPDARSPHGAGGRGIAWYEVGGEVLGFCGAGSSGYRLPGAAVDAWLDREAAGRRGSARPGHRPRRDRSDGRLTPVVAQRRPERHRRGKG